MMHFFKKSKIVLDCLTDQADLLKIAPVDFASNHYPEWWKKLPNTYRLPGDYFDRGTMKGCAGMVDHYKYSVTIPLWSDLAIQVSNRNIRWQFADFKTKGTTHNEVQRGPDFLPPDKFAHLKLVTPWVFKTKENINWVWSYPFFSFEDPSELLVMPGIVNYKYQNSTNINTAILWDCEKTIFIPQGQPLVHLTPMTERKIEIRRHLVDEKEFKELSENYQGRNFLKSYYKKIAGIKKFSKCPFSIGQ